MKRVCRPLATFRRFCQPLAKPLQRVCQGLAITAPVCRTLANVLLFSFFTLRFPLGEAGAAAPGFAGRSIVRQPDMCDVDLVDTVIWYAQESVASSVTSKIEGKNAVAEIREPGVRLHWKGGTVKPTEGHKALAIPNDPDVKGIWPSEHRQADPAGTFLAWPKGKAFGFIAKRHPKGSKDRTLHVLWWLKTETHHEADPTVVPEDALVQGVQKACASVCRALARGGKA